jgi:amino acid transporter
MYVLNEVKNPVHTVKIAGPLGLLICGILYVLANISYYAAATPEEIANSGVTVAGYFMGKVFGESAERALRYASFIHTLYLLLTTELILSLQCPSGSVRLWKCPHSHLRPVPSQPRTCQRRCYPLPQVLGIQLAVRLAFSRSLTPFYPFIYRHRRHSLR